jgi:CubicO group peptidase (beta-lactamase class C family)
MKRWLSALVGLFALLLVSTTSAQRSGSAARPAPESVGVSTERLARMHSAMQQFVDRKEVSGLVTLVERGGKVIDVYSTGEQDIERHVKMSDATIFRIASMSKPITAVAILMLHEEGKFLLTDPVSRFIPAFRDMKVAAADGTTAAARRPITIRDLLTHRSGISYGFLDRGAVGNAYRQSGVPDGLSTYDGTLADAIDRLAAQPLLSQPGAEWHYSLAFDVLGRVVEVVSGKPFDQFLQERLFGPLRMNDTSFVVSDVKWPRFATAYVREGVPGSGALGVSSDLRPIKDPETFNGTLTYSPWAMYKGPKRHFSGGAGLTSTVRDYARFTQMLLNGGELDGVRILSPKTVELMSTSHTNDLPAGAVSIGGPGNSFGLGVRVVTDLGASQTLGSVGMYGWTGIYGTSFWVDPKETLSGVLMIQRNGGVAPVQNTFQTMTYQAIVK